MTCILKAIVMLFLFFFVVALANASFEEDAMRYVNQDFPGQDIRLVWDQPDRVVKLPLGIKIISYKNIGQNTVQFTLQEQAQPVQARVDFWVEVPTLIRATGKGSVISGDDIVMQKSALSTLVHEVVLKKEDLIGKAPKAQVLPAMQPINFNDLVAPIIVKRNAMLTVVYRTDTVTVTTKAKALKDGAAGDQISFEVAKAKNGKKQIDAVIVDQHTAEVKVAQVA